jgi:mRNA interferase RelE/StbE
MIVHFRNSFRKDIEEIKDQKILSQLKHTLHLLEQTVSLNDIHHVKKLKASGNYFRIRMGDYRIGMVVEEQTIILVRFLHRKEIYRFFP